MPSAKAKAGIPVAMLRLFDLQLFLRRQSARSMDRSPSPYPARWRHPAGPYES